MFVKKIFCPMCGTQLENDNLHMTCDSENEFQCVKCGVDIYLDNENRTCVTLEILSEGD